MLRLFECNLVRPDSGQLTLEKVSDSLSTLSLNTDVVTYTASESDLCAPELTDFTSTDFDVSNFAYFTYSSDNIYLEMDTSQAYTGGTISLTFNSFRGINPGLEFTVTEQVGLCDTTVQNSSIQLDNVVPETSLYQVDFPVSAITVLTENDSLCNPTLTDTSPDVISCTTQSGQDCISQITTVLNADTSEYQLVVDVYASDSVIDGDINVIVQYYNTLGSVIRDHQTITINMDPCYLNIIDVEGNHMELVSGSDTCATQNAYDLEEGTLSFYVEALHDGCPNVF